MQYTNAQQQFIREHPPGKSYKLLTVGGQCADGYSVRVTSYTIHNGALCFYSYGHGDNPPFLATQIGEEISEKVSESV